MGKPDDVKMDIITVSVEDREELTASAADLFVSVVGESFFTGWAALKKTREVNDLVVALSAAGVAERDIHLQSVRATTSTGILRRAPRRAYHLRVRCPSLEVVGEAIGAITAQKNTDLRPIVWDYSAAAAGLRDRMLDRATRRAHEIARRIAANLGVRLAGVHRYAEEFLDPEGDDYAFAILAAQRAGSAARGRASRGNSVDMDVTLGELHEVAREDLGMNVTHTKEVRLRVHVDYYVSDYVGAETPPA